MDGDWGQWGSYTTCSKTCGTGSRSRSRACDKPSPSNGGLSCVLAQGGRALNEIETQNCNDGDCIGEWCLLYLILSKDIRRWTIRLNVIIDNDINQATNITFDYHKRLKTSVID